MQIFSYIFHAPNWQSWFNRTPLFVGVGALLYVILPAEPSLWAGLLALPCAAAAYVMRRKQEALQVWLALLLALLGLWLAAWQGQHQGTAFITKHYRYVPFSATVEEVIATDSKHKLILRDVRSPEIERELPLRLRITARLKGLALKRGDRISGKATIFPPSRPSMPSSFDFTRYFFYRGIDGVGYATGTLTLDASAPPSDWAAVHVQLQNIRQSLADAMLRMTQQPASGVVVALATGQKEAITKKTRDALRDASLGHMLAISGMHMGIVCGVTFFALRFLLACVPALALRYPIKQLSALCGLVIGAAYLALADFPISAIRAYTMIAIVFAAILVNRQADTLRSIVLAALCILLIAPSSIAEIGFQLSFCATLALVLAYRRMREMNERTRLKERPFWMRFPVYVGEMGLTSFIAGMVTAPLVAYHFNHFTLYGILANVCALPILSFIVAPSMLLAVIAMPFGMQAWLLRIAEMGIEWIIAIASFISDMPHATLHIAPLSGVAVLVMLVCVFGVITAKHYKAVCMSLMLFAGALATTFFTSQPDILVAEDASAMAVKREHDWLLLKGSPRNFHVEQWAQTLGETFVTYKKAKPEDWVCDKAGCDGVVKGEQVRLRFDYKIKEPLCLENTDIVISSFYSNRWKCAAKEAVRVDRDALERQGAHALTVAHGGITSWNSCKSSPGRVWSRCMFSHR